MVIRKAQMAHYFFKMDYVLQERMVALDSLLLVTTRGCNLESHYSVGYKCKKSATNNDLPKS